MILTVTLNPCVDHTVFVQELKVGDTNRILRTETDAGGKGVNLSRVAVELGASSMATGLLGGGPGAFVRKVLDVQGVPHQFVDIANETRTNFNVESQTGGPPSTFNAPGPDIDEASWRDLLVKVESLLPQAKWIALGGSLPPGVTESAFHILGDLAHHHGVRVVLDADGPAQIEGLKAMPDLIKPNDKEAARLLNRKIESDADALEAAAQLYDRIGGGKRYALLSRGKAGAVLVCAEGRFLGQSPKIEAKSTIGSGDSMIAGFLSQIEKENGPLEALRWGLAAGAATAITDGSEIGRRPVVERLLPEVQVQKV